MPLRYCCLLGMFTVLFIFWNCDFVDLGCKRPGYCSFGKICHDGKCVPSPSPCEKRSDCLNGQICNNGNCESCQHDHQCTSDQRCRSGKCSSSCRVDGDCAQSHLCRQSKCVPTCNSDQSCTGGKRCINDVCSVPIACKTSRNCPNSNHICQDSICRFVKCHRVSECPGGASCISGLCSSRCSSDGDCSSSYWCDRDICTLGSPPKDEEDAEHVDECTKSDASCLDN